MVSVIIPTYNREKCIERAARSVLDQTYTDLELIIVDDGSTDSTKEIVEGITDDRVKYVFQENAGACAARNHGIALSKGEYIAFQDSDDIWNKGKLQKQVDILENNADVDIVCCRTVLKQLDGNTIITAQNVKEGFVDLDQGPIGFSTQTLVLRRAVIEKNLFDPCVTRYQDLDFLIGAMQEGFALYCIAECLVERTNGADSITNNPQRVFQMAKYFESKYDDIFHQSGNFLSRFFSSVLLESACALKKSQQEYKHVYKEAFALDSSMKTYAKYLALNTGLFTIYKKIRSRNSF